MGEKGDEIRLQVRRGAELSGGPWRPTASASKATTPRTRPSKRIHPSGVRRFTERQVAHLLLRWSSLSRVELARRTGLSAATTGKIIDTLVGAGFVEKIASETSAAGPVLGRPAEYFSLARGRRRYVVVELGVQRTQVAALPIAGPVGDIQTAQFRTPSDADTFGRRLKSAVTMLDINEPLAVLVSVPGVVDEFAKRVLYSPNLHWTEGGQLFDTIVHAVPSRLVIVQEIRALALGYLVRSDPNDSYLLIDTGDGVGAAIVVDGHLQTGPLPLSAEIGHTPIRGNRRMCGCGGMGCLETLLNRRGLLRSARRHRVPPLRTWAELVAELADHDPPDWLQQTLVETARVIAGALNMAGVSKVVLVGDLLELGPRVLECMTTCINSSALWGRFGNIRVEAAPRQRLLGLTLAALDRVILAPTSYEEAFERRDNGGDVEAM